MEPMIKMEEIGQSIAAFQDAAREFFGRIPRVDMLDHGFVKMIELWGSDRAIVEAARESTDKGFLGWEPGQCPICMGTGKEPTIRGGEPTDDPCYTCGGKGSHRGDAKLLRFLYVNKHSTPFEMAGGIFQIQAPIAVFREWHRHRTQGFSEMSARYVPLPDLNYVPTVERLLISSKTNKQAGVIEGADVLDEMGAIAYRQELREQYRADETFYQKSLRMGVPKELARMHLPVGRYSRMRATAVLRNWLLFMTLRSAAGAQWEIRQYSHTVGDFLEQAFPRTLELFHDDTGL